jgi:hypothetical protein
LHENQKQSTMVIRGPLILFLFLFLFVQLVASGGVATPNYVNRSSFPAGFLFGTASSSYQVCFWIYVSFNECSKPMTSGFFKFDFGFGYAV